MDLSGIKINIIGDSITEGCGTSGPAYAYPSLLADRTGATVRNFGVCGTRFAHQTRPSEMPTFDLDFVGRAEEMPSDADLVLVFGGTNDFGHGDAPFGTFDDRTADTFCGACHVLMRRLIERYPDAVIVFMTPLHRADENNPKTDSRTGKTYVLEDYVRQIRKTAAYYALPVLDLWGMSGLQPAVPFLTERYMPDGLHPNDAGHRILCDRILGFLRAL